MFTDKNFDNLSEIWLSGDHYKWRAMRANGIEEDYITGHQSDYDKFLAWAKTVPNTFGNPLYHWTHLELLRYFKIDVLLDESSALAIWEEANEKLTTKEMSVRSLLKQDKVEFLGTTDDPIDTLEIHQKLNDEEWEVTVSPSFRPDKGLNIESEAFHPWLDQLRAVTNHAIDNYDGFLEAMANRVDFFDEHGCRSSDHGLNSMFYEKATKDEVAAIFQKCLNGEKLNPKEVEQYKTYTLIRLGEMYADKDWTMQLHVNPLRNNNQRMFHKIGPDTGFDSIGNQVDANKIANFLNALDEKSKLPQTILYSLNGNDNHVLAAMAGNFQSSEVPGKVQLGTAWRFNDTIDGMEDQMKTLANIGLISNFIGMLTDSRSFLSFSRHEYFRRILCNLLGTWVEENKIPKDMNLLKKYVTGICYENALRYFRLN